jgi:hypothetical protein
MCNRRKATHYWSGDIMLCYGTENATGGGAHFTSPACVLGVRSGAERKILEGFIDQGVRVFGGEREKPKLHDFI